MKEAFLPLTPLLMPSPDATVKSAQPELATVPNLLIVAKSDWTSGAVKSMVSSSQGINCGGDLEMAGGEVEGEVEFGVGGEEVVRTRRCSLRDSA